MSSSQIESIMNLLTNDTETANKLVNLSKTLIETRETESEPAFEKKDKNTDKLQLKINLINAIIPLLNDKAAEQAQFLIKLLTVISVINQLKNDNS